MRSIPFWGLGVVGIAAVRNAAKPTEEKARPTRGSLYSLAFSVVQPERVPQMHLIPFARHRECITFDKYYFSTMEIALVSAIITAVALIWSVFSYLHSRKTKKKMDNEVIKELKRSNDINIDHKRRKAQPVFQILGFNGDHKFIIIRMKVHNHNLTVEDIRLEENDFCMLDDNQPQGYFDRNKGYFCFSLLHNLGPSTN